MIHSLIILAGTVFFIWFSIPLFTHRILNIGNLTGLVVSGILLIGGIFYKNFQQGIFYLQKYFLGKCVIGIMAIAIGIVVITAVIETVLIVKASAKKPQENATLIVLGCKVYGEHASRSLRERLDAALIYLEENPNSQCIVSGGMGEGEKISEAECMYRYLTKKGINSSRIIKEDKSTSTRENLRFSKKIMEEKGLGNNIAIATSEYHQYRAFPKKKKTFFLWRFRYNDLWTYTSRIYRRKRRFDICKSRVNIITKMQHSTQLYHIRRKQDNIKRRRWKSNTRISIWEIGEEKIYKFEL